jgi:hypothetical protein
MKKFYTLSLLCLLFKVAAAQTNVSGFINANTTWTLAGSPYIVVGNALLVHGYTLTIDPGVVVKFDSAKALQIDGELIAVGTPANRITFTTNQVNPTPGDWSKIQFSDTSVDAVYDIAGNYVSGSIMRYCDVSYAGSVGFGSIHIVASSPYITNCRISYSGEYGIFCSVALVRIDSSKISYSENRGIFSTGESGPCPFILQYDTIEYNQRGGVRFNNPFNFSSCGPQSILFYRNYFNSNSGDGAFYMEDLNPVINIVENTFINNNNASSSALTVGGKFIIECNKFINNSALYVSAITVTGTGTTSIIRNNLFEGNYSTDSTGYPCVVYINAMSATDVLIHDNIFRNNDPTNNGAICYFRGYWTGNLVSHYFIHNNGFSGNYGREDIRLFIGLTDFSLQFATLTNNNFLSSNTQYIIYNEAPFGGPNIDADSNYWGTTSSVYIDSKIYDYFDYPNYSVVYYPPPLASPAPIDSNCLMLTSISSHKTDEEMSFIIYPNPAHNTFTISFNGLSSMVDGQLQIFDVMGREVYAEKIHSQVSTFNFQLSPGIYFVKVRIGEKVFTEKMVVE